MSATARKFDDQRVESASAGTVSASAAALPSFRILSTMPWEAGLDEDRRFRRFALHGLGVCVTLMLLVALLPAQKQAAPVAQDNREQYAQLVIEEKYIPPPPEPEAVEPEKIKPEPKVEPAKPKPVEVKPPPVLQQPKPVETPEPIQPKVTEVQKRAEARERAANAGLLAMSDQLAAMRQQTSSRSVSELKSAGEQSAKPQRKLIAAKTNSSLSGGASVSQQSANVGLAGREQAAVVVSEAAVQAVQSSAAASQYQQSRSADEVRRVMDANKGGIYSVYNRALRKNPLLQGTLSFSMTIEPSGAISSVSLVNSELSDPALEKRLLARIRMIKFEPADVGSTQVNYSFDFLPN